MNIFLLDVLDQSLLERLINDNVIYRPDLLHKKTSALDYSLQVCKVDAIISRAELPITTIQQWSVSHSPTYQVQVIIGDTPSSIENVDVSNYGHIKHHCFLKAYGDNESSAYIAAFELLEREFNRRMIGYSVSKNKPVRSFNHSHVMMVGAGIVNLVTAHTLQEAGYQVHFVDSGPDPRDVAPWTAYGCSRGGGDARMFTFSEMNNYHDKQVSTTMNDQFSRFVNEKGWGIHRQGTLSRSEQEWIEDFQSLPTWLASIYNENIFSLNQESYLIWESWRRNDPELFSTSFFRDGIVRLFSDKTTFKHKVLIQNRLGAIQSLLSPEEVAFKNPGLADAVLNGQIAGGANEIGFTIRVHEFMRLLIARLSAAGAEFTWNQTAKNILIDSNNRVTGIQLSDKLLKSCHYVISCGAYGNTLLTGTRSHQKIHGVLGVWLNLPNIEPQLQHSLKIRRTGHITEAANITISLDDDCSPILILGSGYGHTGVDPNNIDEGLLKQMYLGLVDTAQKYFPKSYEAALEKGGVESTFKYCVRPWTSTGLGIFEILETADSGKFIVTGGHNTGGFAQSPAVAQAVLATLNGKEHAMQYLYHPDRASHFLSTIRK